MEEIRKTVLEWLLIGLWKNKTCSICSVRFLYNNFNDKTKIIKNLNKGGDSYMGRERNTIPDFTQPEMTYLLEKCNFTKDEKELFLLRNEENTLECCAELMDYSISTVKRINKKMKNKIIKVI